MRAVLTLTVALAGGAALVGPAFATLVTTPPLRITPTIPAIRVRTFENLGARGCIPEPPLHAGPSFVTGAIGSGGALRQRIESAMWRCLDDWHGDVALSVEIDRTGNIIEVVADTADLRMQGCLVGRIFAEGPVATRGPGRLNATYFMGSEI